MAREYRAQLQKHLVNLYEGDMDTLKGLYPSGASVIIRKLVRMHIHLVNSKVSEKFNERELQDE